MPTLPPEDQFGLGAVMEPPRISEPTKPCRFHPMTPAELDRAMNEALGKRTLRASVILDLKVAVRERSEQISSPASMREWLGDSLRDTHSARDGLDAAMSEEGWLDLQCPCYHQVGVATEDAKGSASNVAFLTPEERKEEDWLRSTIAHLLKEEEGVSAYDIEAIYETLNRHLESGALEVGPNPAANQVAAERALAIADIRTKATAVYHTLKSAAKDLPAPVRNQTGEDRYVTASLADNLDKGLTAAHRKLTQVLQAPFLNGKAKDASTPDLE